MKAFPWVVLALMGCDWTGSGIEIDPGRFASSRIAIVDFGSDSSAFRSDFPPDAFPTHVKPFHGKDWEVSGVSIRLFSPAEAFIQFDCSLRDDFCVVAGRDIGLDSNAYFQFAPGEKLLAFIAECGKKTGNLESLPSFRFERRQAEALRSKFHGMKVVIGRNKLGHKPETVSLGGDFDGNQYEADSLVEMLKAEGAVFGSEPVFAIEPSNVYSVQLTLGFDQSYGSEDDTSAFQFMATTRSTVADRSELIEIFFGSKAKWVKDDFSLCGCKTSWYRVEFDLKSERSAVEVEVDPCGEGYQKAIREVQGEIYALHLPPAHSRKVQAYFGPLVENQRKIRKATQGGSGSCAD